MFLYELQIQTVVCRTPPRAPLDERVQPQVLGRSHEGPNCCKRTLSDLFRDLFFLGFNGADDGAEGVFLMPLGAFRCRRCS